MKIIPEKLTEARCVRGLNVTELANLIGVTRQAVSRYEQGASDPSENVMIRVCEELNFPIEFFTNTLVANRSLNTTFFRSLKTSEAKMRTSVEIKCLWTGEIREFMAKMLNLPKLNLPCLDLVINKPNYTKADIEYCAKALRRHWNLGDKPIFNLAYEMEKNGIIISGASIDNSTIDACHSMVYGHPIVFIGTDKSSCCRERFSLSHELGHLILHGHITRDDLKEKSILSKIESEANYFAGAFLLPEETILTEITSTKINHLLYIKERWKVSLAAIICRCENLGIIDEYRALQLRKQLSYKKWRKKEPFDDEIPVEQPQLLQSGLDMIFSNGLISKSSFLDYFNYPLEDMAEICNVDKSYFIEDRLPISIIR